MSDTTGSSAGSLKASSLRERLRLDTRAAHDALDERLGTLDLQNPDHLAAFLAVQAEGFAALRDGLSAALSPQDRDRAATLLDSCHRDGLSACG